MDKVKQIKKEKQRLLQFYAALPEAKMALALPLIEQAAFMRVTLDGLQISINENGGTEEYKNGANQYGNKASAEMSAYNALIKNYTNVIDRLDKMLPTVSAGGKLAALLNE